MVFVYGLATSTWIGISQPDITLQLHHQQHGFQPHHRGSQHQQHGSQHHHCLLSNLANFVTLATSATSFITRQLHHYTAAPSSHCSCTSHCITLRHLHLVTPSRHITLARDSSASHCSSTITASPLSLQLHITLQISTLHLHHHCSSASHCISLQFYITLHHLCITLLHTAAIHTRDCNTASLLHTAASLLHTAASLLHTAVLLHSKLQLGPPQGLTLRLCITLQHICLYCSISAYQLHTAASLLILQHIRISAYAGLHH